MKYRYAQHSPIDDAFQLQTSRSQRSRLDICSCASLASYAYPTPLPEQHSSIDEDTEQVLSTKQLSLKIQTHLQPYLSQGSPLGILVLHAYQQESDISVSAPISTVTHRRFHVPPSVFEQFMAAVRRAIRSNDQLLCHANTGAALLLPGIDQTELQHILERVYTNLDLLQGKTLHPPITRDTIVQLGCSAYPGSPIDDAHLLFQQASSVARRLLFRTALRHQLNGIKPAPPVGSPLSSRTVHSHTHTPHVLAQKSVPFMQLPTTLPRQVITLVPYSLALEIRCIPIGQHQQHLTVAMTHPTDLEGIRRLQQATGLTIFPVACDEDELNSLLTQKW